MSRRNTMLALCAVIALDACGYRIVRTDDVRAKRFVVDSAARVALESQIVSMRAQCTADSIRLTAAIAAARAMPAPSPAAAAPDSIVKARDAEIATLKDQLAKANAELDRIKRRLANPRGE